MDSNGVAIGDYTYDVFLSFRGKDTRQGFTDVLYEFMIMADVRVFRDDDELAIGDKIDSILEAIKSSKICIPIFSPNFAESKWCLREVTRMVELKKTIVPVFYNVSPDDLKLKEKSVYADDFIKLQQNHGDRIIEINNWKNSLREAASNKGRVLGNKRYTQFCKEFVNEVIPKLGPRKRLDMEHYFVGDTNKAAVIEKLEMGSSSQQVIYLGLHGMGGIGKTTLTKLIYNDFLPSFEYCAFLPDIREFSEREGVNKLPSHLSENLQPKSNEPISRSDQIPNLFSDKKVLIILDDVDSDEQIKKIAQETSWFGSGSRIILSSRDKEVFQNFEAESSRCDFRYLEMGELDHRWSLELFSRCAFGKVSPPLPFKDLSRSVIASAGGLPLAITVIAKQLRNQKERVWEDIIERLKKTLPKKVKARLLISYESLENEHKTIFLDIACLFINKVYSEESYMFYMWEDCGLYPRWSLEVLQSRSLIKIIEHTPVVFQFQIHDQLRNLGRDIVIDKSGRDLTKQSRLWEKHEVLEVLKCKEKQKNMIEAIRFFGGGSWDPKPIWSKLSEEFSNLSQKRWWNFFGIVKSFPRLLTLSVLLIPREEDIVTVFRDQEFASFDNLRYLELYRSKLRGDFSNVFPKLRYLGCGLHIMEARNLAPPNLVFLDLFNNNVDENWDGWNQILVLKKLKVLHLKYCSKLQRTPVFPENMPLEILNLSHCDQLEYIDASIGKLQHLTQLNLRQCMKLKKLPDSIGELEKLEDLDLSGIGLQRTPVFLKNMSLKVLNLSCCYELEYIYPFGKLQQHLTQLDLSTCLKLKKLPDYISRLEKLEDLNLNGSGLQKTPVFLDNMSLKILNLSDCGELEYINTSIGKLQHLTQLNLSRCKKLKKLPDSIGGLGKLEELDLSFCELLVELPQSLGNLHSLRTLRLSNARHLSALPDLSHLQDLNSLWIDGCQKLTKIPVLINLKRLRELDIKGCKSREIFEVASRLKKLYGVEVRGIPDWYAI